MTPKDQANLAEAKLFDAQRMGQEIENAQQQMQYEEYKRKVTMFRSVDANNRIFDFSEPITSEHVGIAIATFSAWKRQSTDPMTIIFNSPGGSILDGLNLFDYIRALAARDSNGDLLGPDAIDPDSQKLLQPTSKGVYVTTIAMGMTASMAAVLLQAGNRRVVTPNAYVMLHEAASRFAGKLSDVRDDLKFSERLNSRNIDILAERSNLSTQEITDIIDRKDVYFDANETLAHGLADAKGYA